MQPEGQQSQQQPGWQFVSGDTATTMPTDAGVSDVKWTASEFIAYHKNAGWYTLALLAIVTIAVLTFLLTSGDLFSTISISVLGLLFIIFASRKPRVLEYQISNTGVKIGEKLHTFKEIKSFSVIDEGMFRSISLYPLQRFMPAISIYFEPQEEAKIVQVLGKYLPQEQRKQELVDKFMHKIRF